jgi:hypothetical protein
MVLGEKQTTVAYRCPECGAGVMSAVGIFRLSADMVKLKCTCGKSEMKIVYSKGDSNVRLTVPCLLCSSPHNFTVSSSLFFKDELFVLPCPYSDINICMTGEMNLVKAELARTELELLDLLEENGITDFSALHSKEEELADPQIRDIVLFVIRDLEAEGKIFCRCHPEPEGGAPVSFDNSDISEDSRYEAEITDDGVKVTCLDCGASRTIPTDSMLGAHAFLNCDKLYLE